MRPGPEVVDELREMPQSTRRYLDAFELSQYYKKALQQAVAERVKSGAKRDMVIKRFPDLEPYKRALWDYYRDGNRLSYNAASYNTSFISTIESYWAKTRAMMLREKLQRLDPNTLEHLDHERSAAHTAAARQLVKMKQAPNENIGRLLVHFLSVDQGLDTPTPGRDEMRRQAYRSR